jgi:hypothetical protein
MLIIQNTDRITGHRISDDWVFGKVVLHRWDYYFYINDTDGNQRKDVRLHRHLVRDDCYRLRYGSNHIDITKAAIEDRELFSFYVSVLIGGD